MAFRINWSCSLSVEVIPSLPTTGFETIDLDESQEEQEDENAGLASLPDGRVTCLKCGKTLSCDSSARRHYQLYHLSNQPATCPVCKKVFKNRLYRGDHLRKAHNISAYAMKHTMKPPSSLSWRHRLYIQPLR